MNIAFRVDASSEIGTGHLMRCLALAEELKQRGARTCFVSRHLPGPFQKMLDGGQHGFAHISGATTGEANQDLEHGHWLGTSQARDAADTVEALSGRRWDWLVVDHYALDARWESMLRDAAAKILVIDDIADRKHDCDLLLDQNLHEKVTERYLEKAPSDCEILLGPRYALLREEFRSLRTKVMARDGAVRRILIFFGGIDACNYTAQTIEAIAMLNIADLHVDVVIGAQHPEGAQISSQCLRYGFAFHQQTSRMAELIAAADLAVGAGGTAIWERCCLGLPAVAICTAQNQKEQIAAAAFETLLYAPEGNAEYRVRIARHVMALIENPLLRRAISCAGMEAVDGRGVWRVADNMGCWGIEIRVASTGDSRNLFQWRNDPSVRAVSRSADLIGWDTHQEWLTSVLNTPASPLLIGERQGSPRGVVRFDIEGQEAEVSIYLVPGDHPPGEGGRLLRSAEGWLAANRPQVVRIRARILAGNARSERLFQGAGYRLEFTHYAKRLGGRSTEGSNSTEQ